MKTFNKEKNPQSLGLSGSLRVTERQGYINKDSLSYDKKRIIKFPSFHYTTSRLFLS